MRNGLETVIELTMLVHPGMPTNRPDHRPPRFEAYASIDSDGWAGTNVTIDTHCGTHVDAPSHFVAGAQSAAGIPLETLVGPATRLDVPAGTGAVELPGPLASRVVLHTGWSDRIGSDLEGYFQRSASLSPAFAERLVAAGVLLVGIDAPSVDAPGEDVIHRTLLGAGVVVVENLANTRALPARFDLTVLPLRLDGLDGSPARAIARLGATA